MVLRFCGEYAVNNLVKIMAYPSNEILGLNDFCGMMDKENEYEPVPKSSNPKSLKAES
jgi:hypothetical protein